MNTDEPLIDTRLLERKTLRDEFAMAALQGYIASFAGLNQGPNFEIAVQWAFVMADLAMKERAK